MTITTIAKSTQGIQSARTDTSAMMTAYLAELDRTPKTRETYRRALGRYIEWLDAWGVDVLRATTADVIEYKRQLAATKSASTVNAYLAAVRSLYKWLAYHDVCANVAADVNNVRRATSHKRGWLGREQCWDLLDHVDAEATDEAGLRDRAIIYTMLICGLRTIEIVRANVGDLARMGDRTTLKVWGKGHAEADTLVDVPEEAARAICDYLKARGHAEAGAPLFAGVGNRNKGGRMTTRTLRTIVARAYEGAGVSGAGVSAHSLRHTCITNAIKAGAELRDAQVLARHSDPKTTLVYIHEEAALENRAGRAGLAYLKRGR